MTDPTTTPPSTPVADDRNNSLDRLEFWSRTLETLEVYSAEIRRASKAARRTLNEELFQYNLQQAWKALAEVAKIMLLADDRDWNVVVEEAEEQAEKAQKVLFQ